MMKHITKLMLVSGLCGLTLASVSLAQPQAKAKHTLVPIETLFQSSAYKSYKLSPDGKKLAALVPVNKRDNLVVIDLEKRSRTGLTNFDTFDVTAIQWITNDRIFFRVTEGRDVGEKVKYKGSYAIDIDGNNVRHMERLRGSPNGISLVSVVDRQTGDVILAANLRRKASADLYLSNTKTNKLELITNDAPADTKGYVLDADRVARFAFTNNAERGDTNDYELWYRDNADAKWRKLHTISEGKPHWIPVGFLDEGNVIISSDIGRNTAALFEYDPKTERIVRLIHEDARIDMSRDGDFINLPDDEDNTDITWNPLISLKINDADKNATVVGIRYHAGNWVNKWFHPALQKIQADLDSALPGRFNSFNPNVLKGSRVLITSRSMEASTRFFIYDPKAKNLEELPSASPWLEDVPKPKREFIEYTARDGLKIPAYLSLPRHKEAKNLPLIVNIHGGPYLRNYDIWGNLEQLFFTNRGYVVLEPEPRGSKGWGREHYTKAFGAWGTTMQDDITDGVLDLVKKGIVDPKRVCLYGGSYGGYATLQGLVREPDMFRCGISIVAVTDLELFQNTTWGDIPVEKKAMQDWFKERVGAADAELIKRTSPAQNADKIKAPILLVMGESDVRVPIQHGRKMRDAMSAQGKALDYHVYVGEGHGWRKPENRFDFYTRVENFLNKHNPAN
ncbi:MAG: Dipeptidyl aminopeptidase [Pseudomonadota bacterium]